MKKKWYDDNIKLLLSVLFPPLALYGIIKRKTKQTRFKIFAIIVVGLMVFIPITIFSMAAYDIANIDYNERNLNKGIKLFEEKKFEGAIADFKKVKTDSEYYTESQQRINQSIDSLNSIKIKSQLQKEKMEKTQEQIIQHSQFWADSIVKEWNGSFIVDYKKPINDTIFFNLSPNASRNFSSTREMNLSLYQKSLHNSILNKLGSDYKGGVIVEFIQDEESRRENIAASNRRDKILRQFGGWNNSHRNLERLIKKTMNDPDSYEHVNTTYTDKGDYIMVYTTIRETNAFGATVKSSFEAKVNLEGEILSVQ